MGGKKKKKTEIKCPINTYIEPTYSLIFIAPFHLFHSRSSFPPEHVSLLSCENWASNLRLGQEMTHRVTAASAGAPTGRTEEIDPCSRRQG